MYYSVVLALLVVVGVSSAWHFCSAGHYQPFLEILPASANTIARPKPLWKKMMTGQKVIKVFCHEEGAKADFDKVNGEIFFNAETAIVLQTF